MSPLFSTGKPVKEGLYANNMLQVVREADEDGHVVYTFTDMQGRTILTRAMDGTAAHDTYSVYDASGNLCHVLQPMFQEDGDLSKYAFRYEYDERNRLAKKMLPGTEPVLYEYDLKDRMTFSQDGNQRTAGKWTYYLYDGLNRLTEQGECTGKDLSTKTVLLQNYYDDYAFRGSAGFDNGNFPAGTVDATGYLTGTAQRVLDTDKMLHAAYYYDIKGRIVKTVQENTLGGHDVTETVYTFTGNPQTVTHTHSASGKPTVTEVYAYTYDHADRVTKVEHTLDGTKVTLAGYEYDELERVKARTLHGNAANRQAYAYNIRGWLTNISGNRFMQNLYYETGSGTPAYNGNISSMTWRAGSEGTMRGYKFAYDGLDRLENATYGEGMFINANTGRFSENVTSYDLNGNITGLQRYGQTGSSYGLVDNLTFTLNGNQLNRVDDSANGGLFEDAVKQANEYAYDRNANMTKDLNRNISSITYNSLNLPNKITFGDGSTIANTYLVDGTKLNTVRTIGGATTTTDYCGNAVYENGTLKYLLTEEGYVMPADGKYHYYLTDHLGNNRVVVDQNGTVEEVNHYYPFGGMFASTDVQPYKYNGKEWDEKAKWYDYGARSYDPALMRFNTMDPMAESYYSISPYAYCGNNPVLYIDKTGMNYGPGDVFKTKRDAANDWGAYYNGASIIRKKEMGSTIYVVKENGQIKGYAYTESNIGTAHQNTPSTPSDSEEIVATIHSHGNYDGTITNEKGEKKIVHDNAFSKADREANNKLNLTGYLATPNGSLLEYDPLTGETSTISTDLPSDSNDPTRQNKKPAEDNIPSPTPTTWIEDILNSIVDLIESLIK